MLSEGDPVPDVQLTTPEGATIGPRDFAGRKLVIYFYPKDDTSGCTSEAKDFTALADQFTAAGIMVIGVSKDSPASHKKFIAKHGLAVPLATDADGSVCEALGTWVEKNMYGRKYMGIERATFLVGKDGRIARIWRKVKVSGHAAEVLAAAKALD